MSTIQRPFISRIELKDAISSIELVSFFSAFSLLGEVSDGGVLRGRHIHNEKGGVWELKQRCLRATRARASKMWSGFFGNTPRRTFFESLHQHRKLLVLRMFHIWKRINLSFTWERTKTIVPVWEYENHHNLLSNHWFLSYNSVRNKTQLNGGTVYPSSTVWQHRPKD